jgi:hypothetical protein
VKYRKNEIVRCWYRGHSWAHIASSRYPDPTYFRPRPAPIRAWYPSPDDHRICARGRTARCWYLWNVCKCSELTVENSAVEESSYWRMRAVEQPCSRYWAQWEERSGQDLNGDNVCIRNTFWNLAVWKSSARVKRVSKQLWIRLHTDFEPECLFE